jgi:glucose/mannose-6-phosphate isomerase
MRDRSRGFGELRARLDSKGMFDLLRAFPAQMVDAWELGKRFAGALGAADAPQVVVCGMGGSAIGADMARSFLGHELSVPIHVNRFYDVPASLQRGGFFVFSSYSGDTAETLAAYDAVRAAKRPAVAITTGGELGRRCGRDGVPVCVIPGGMPPRAAIGYSFFPLLHILGALGAAPVDEAGFSEAVGALEKRCDEYAAETGGNEAVAIAERLEGKTAYILSRGGLFEAVARRWSCQLGENGKTLSHFASFTELNHNEIMGWCSRKPWHERIVVISLEDEEDHPAAGKQADIALGIIGPLSAFASVYLAYLNGVDPTPISVIDFLKDRLRETTG